MNVLLIGGGGREHALAWKLAASPRLDTLYCAPGNGGMAGIATLVDLNPNDHKAVIGFCRDHDVGLVVVGPEDPLVNGLVDALDAAGIKAFGPSAKAAQLEGSKGFTKDLCARANIPTAAYGRFEDAESAKAYVQQNGAPIVIKADGLAAGKGVTVAMTLDEALDAVDHCFSDGFGAVVVEEFLEGEEASFFVLVDGNHALPLATAQDHKRIGDGDTGPNTGGMGAYSPAPVMTDALCDQVMRDIITPTITTMAAEGMPFKGVLYAGLMITKDGPKLIEYNVRFGDPECQVLMLRLQSDLLDLLEAAADGRLNALTAEWRDETALVVVMANKGYPGSYPKDDVISGLENAALPNVQVFHAGTKAEDGKILATGGRVLGVAATGQTVSQAQQLAYKAVDLIDWPHAYVRRDIGWRAIERDV